MKTVIIMLDMANKSGIAGAQKLAKTDELIMLYVKGKKTVSANLKEELADVKATVSYVEIAATADYNTVCAYYVGYHVGKGHDVYVIAADKSKVKSVISKNAKVYTGFGSITGTVGSGKTGTAAKPKKTGTAKKTTTAKKKTTTKKKTSSKKDADDISDILTSLAGGKIDTDKITDTVMKVAKKKLKESLKK